MNKFAGRSHDSAGTTKMTSRCTAALLRIGTVTHVHVYSESTEHSSDDYLDDYAGEMDDSINADHPDDTVRGTSKYLRDLRKRLNTTHKEAEPFERRLAESKDTHGDAIYLAECRANSSSQTSSLPPSVKWRRPPPRRRRLVPTSDTTPPTPPQRNDPSQVDGGVKGPRAAWNRPCGETL